MEKVLRNNIIYVEIIPTDYIGPELNSVAKIGSKRYKVLKTEAIVGVTLKLIEDGKSTKKS